jgi:hypothetical protein
MNAIKNQNQNHKLLLIIPVLFCFFIFQSINAFAYDAKIKDKYGRVTGYLDHKGDKTYIVDKYGKRGDYIESDGDVKDKYGRKKGKIERNK